MDKHDKAREQIARARWRADLLDYTAAQLDTIGHTRQANEKRADAALHREFAELVEASEASGDLSELVTVRKRWREIGEAAGRRGRDPHILDDFAEPTLEELGV